MNWTDLSCMANGESVILNETEGAGRPNPYGESWGYGNLKSDCNKEGASTCLLYDEDNFSDGQSYSKNKRCDEKGFSN